MLHSGNKREPGPTRRQLGFTLLEMLVGLAILLVVTGVVMSGMIEMINTQTTIQNRAEMHSNVRNATELLSQEIGQAGKISLPPPDPLACPLGQVTLTSPVVVAVNPPVAQQVTVCSGAGMFQGEQLTIVDNGPQQETVALTQVAGNAITAIFTQSHLAGVPVAPRGAFASGIVPPAPGVQTAVGWPGYTNPISGAPGSTDWALKLYGDINGDGNMVYVEYFCDFSTNPGTLWRRVWPIIPAGPLSQAALLTTLQNNPGNAPCFTYQPPRTGPTVGPDTYVVDVAVTLSVQTQIVDPETGAFQNETKALLNIAPRNVVEAWELASASVTNRVQPMPTDVANLLAY